MHPYSVTVSETRTRRLRLVAADEAGAAEAARAVLRDGARVVSVQLYGDREVSAAAEALAHLLSRDFLPVRGAVLSLETWLRAAVAGDAAAAAQLALAGLRVEGGRLIVGSPTSVPALAQWFRHTPWAKAELLAVLALVPGAERTNRTFAGVGSRAVSLPLSAVPGLEGGAE